MTPVSVAFRWAMLCTKSELRFRQFSFNHRTRNLRSVKTLRLVPYPLYQHAIVPFEFPRQVGWLFPLFTFNNVPLRGRYTFARSSAQFSAYCPRWGLRFRSAPPRRVRPVQPPFLAGCLWASPQHFSAPPPAQANSAYPLSGYPPPRATAPSAPADCRTGKTACASGIPSPPASAPPPWSLPRTWTPIRRTASGPAPAACRIADTASSYTIPPYCWRSACLWQTPRRARPSTRQDIGIWQTGRWIFSLPSAQYPPHFSALCTKKMCGTHTAAIAV